MASAQTLLICTLILQKSAGSSLLLKNECPAQQKRACESLRSAGGFMYPVILNIPNPRDCEQGWYYQNGTFIVDSTPDANNKKLETVVQVTPENLTLSICANLQWQLYCVTYSCIINYTVIDMDNKHDHTVLPSWGIALVTGIGIVTVIGIGIGIWKLMRLL